MGKGKIIAKGCPKCETQVAVATKWCKCGHSFHKAARRSSVGGAETSPGQARRRTGRVRRARPHFYDSQDYQRQRRKVGKRRSLSRGSLDDDQTSRDDSKDSGKGSNGIRVGRRRSSLKARRREAEARKRAAPLRSALNPALLAEINRKMAAVV